MLKKRMVIDVESVGLHGEGFAVAFVLLEGDYELAHGSACCPATAARGTGDDLKWVQENVTIDPAAHKFESPRQVRDWFWTIWTRYEAEGVELWADCCWPVEANFLAACVADDPTARNWEGPYPLHDVATLMLAGGRDPLGTYHRTPAELPAHNPLADARQSARHMLEVLASPRIGQPAHFAQRSS